MQISYHYPGPLIHLPHPFYLTILQHPLIQLLLVPNSTPMQLKLSLPHPSHPPTLSSHLTIQQHPVIQLLEVPFSTPMQLKLSKINETLSLQVELKSLLL